MLLELPDCNHRGGGYSYFTIVVSFVIFVPFAWSAHGGHSINRESHSQATFQLAIFDLGFILNVSNTSCDQTSPAGYLTPHVARLRDRCGLHLGFRSNLTGPIDEYPEVSLQRSRDSKNRLFSLCLLLRLCRDLRQTEIRDSYHEPI